jgi:hypothetical protein
MWNRNIKIWKRKVEAWDHDLGIRETIIEVIIRGIGMIFRAIDGWDLNPECGRVKKRARKPLPGGLSDVLTSR